MAGCGEQKTRQITHANIENSNQLKLNRSSHIHQHICVHFRMGGRNEPCGGDTRGAAT